MKKRFISGVLCIVFVLTLFPIAVFAAPDMNTYTPYSLSASLVTADETHPYGSAEILFKIRSLPRPTSSAQWFVLIEKKIGEGGEWKVSNEVSSDGFLDTYQTEPGLFKFEQIWVEDYEWNGRTPVSFRVKVVAYDEAFSLTGESGWSNIASIGVQASGWAVPELQKAEGHGLIPDSLSGQDLTKPITREEFAELAVRLYEKTTGKAATPASPNPFTDTKNPEILKAFKLNITTGISADKFAPKELTNRQQVATMLSRAVREMAPSGDFSTAGAPVFTDQKDIDSWALEHVKYMSKLGVIKGIDGKFRPKATTTAQQASGYATTTREQAIAMGVRIFEQYETIKAPSGSASGTPSGNNSAAPSAGASNSVTADFGGEWSLAADLTGQKLTVTITQSGSRITKFVIDGESVTVLSGTVAGKVLNLKVTDGTSPEVTAVFTMADDGKSFKGPWSFTMENQTATWQMTGSKI